MSAYELMFILNPAVGEEKNSQIISKIEDKIKTLGGEIKRTDKWGTRKLESLFKKTPHLEQGYYTVIYFDSPTAVPAKVQAYLKVTEDIVRYSIYKSTGVQEEAKEEIAGVPLPKADLTEKKLPEGEEIGQP